MTNKEIDPKEIKRIKEAGDSGGVVFKSDSPAVHEQRKVLWDFIKQLPGQMLEIKELTNFSLPVTLFEPRSYLQRLTDCFIFPIFLLNAAKTTDPVERLKNVITFLLAGLHNTAGQKKPFNPILGETYQAIFGKSKIEVYVEQISHHPPITAWQIYGSGFHYYGAGEWTASFKGGSVKGGQRGVNTVAFEDGTKIIFRMPSIKISGALFGDRVVEYEGDIEFEYPNYNIYATVKFNPEPFGFWDRFMTFSKKQPLPSDFVKGEIFKKSNTLHDNSDNERVIISTLFGSWLGRIHFDGITYWDIFQQENMDTPIPVEHPLPSDSRFREDLAALQQSDFNLAQKNKVKMEEKQRNEAKLRKHSTGSSKKLFSKQ